MSLSIHIVLFVSFMSLALDISMERCETFENILFFYRFVFDIKYIYMIHPKNVNFQFYVSFDITCAAVVLCHGCS